MGSSLRSITQYGAFSTLAVMQHVICRVISNQSRLMTGVKAQLQVLQKTELLKKRYLKTAISE